MEKLTAVELRGLHASYNLADAHARQELSELERKEIVEQFAELYRDAGEWHQTDLDRHAMARFMQLSGQDSVHPETWFLPVYASSISLEVVANWLRHRPGVVAVVEPTFDSIPDILRRNGLALCSIPLYRDMNYRDGVLSALDLPEVAALLLVIPNNPSGQLLDATAFEQVCRGCAERGALLIVDTSFRLHDERACYDQYEILDRTGVRYIVLEDTGKVWPTQDLKLSYILASPEFRGELTAIHNDFLLNVSPFVSRLVLALATFGATHGLPSVHPVIAANRRLLRAELTRRHSVAVLPYPDSRISVELLTPPLDVPATTACAALMRAGVAVLSGRKFFWRQPDAGEAYLRVALARPPHYFRDGVHRLVEYL